MGWLWVNVFRILFHYLGLLNTEKFKNIDEFYTRKYVRDLNNKNKKWKKH